METVKVEEESSLIKYQEDIAGGLKQAQDIQVTNEATYSWAVELVNDLRDRKKVFLAFIDPHIDRANIAHKKLTGDRKRVVGGYDAVINEAFGKANAWQNEQERIRKIAEAKEMAELKAKEEETRLAEAVELEKAGETERAQEVISAPINIAKPSFPKFEKKLGTRETWYAVVDNKMALVKAVASGDQPAYYLDANMPNLNTQAVKLRDELRIPGVTPKSKEGPSGK